MQDILEKANAFAKAFFENNSDGHDYYHTLRVYRMAIKIAAREPCDKELVGLSALLHDVDDRKLVGADAPPHANATVFLSRQGYCRIPEVCHIIEQISFRGTGSTVPDSIEGKIVQDADRLDALGAVGIGRCFAYGGSKGRPMHDPALPARSNMTAEEYYQNTGTAINHFYEKLLKLKEKLNTQTAREIADHRHAYMEDFLQEFLVEWDCIK